MHLLLLLSLVGVRPALAAPVKPAGVATVSGVVEVPLYAGLDAGDPYSYVEATVGDKKLFLRLATGHRELLLTDAAVARLGLKASGAEGAKKAKVATMTLGAAQLTKVTVTVAPVDPSGALPVDGEIGLPGFYDLAWAVVPSAGVLRLAEGTDGAGLLAAVGGTPMPYGEANKEKKLKIASSKETIKAATLLVPVKWSGVEVDADLDIEAPTTWLAREVEGVDWYTLPKSKKTPVKLPAAPGLSQGATRWEWREVSVGGVARSTSVERKGTGPIWAFIDDAHVGQDVLGALDIALDPVTHQFTAKAAPAVKKADYSAAYEATLRAALEPKLKEGATPPTPEQAAKARAGALGPLADFLEVHGRYDDAVAARKEITVTKADDCTAWLGLGSTLLAAARPSDAVEPLTKATALYQPWSQLALDERTRISGEYAKATGANKEWTGQVPQDASCYVAAGQLALAQVQAHNAAAVATLYPAQLDLDPTLPLAAGNASLLQGHFDAAQAAYLQALKLRGGNEDAARVGLYLALAPHDFAQARMQLERLRLRYEGVTDPLLVRLYVEGVRKEQGAAGVHSALQALLAQDPTDPVLLTQMGRELAAAGDTAGATTAFATAKDRLGADLAARPQDVGGWVSYAGLLLATGQAAEAQKAAETAVKLAPANGMAWLAMADVSAAAGDSAKATESRRHAGMVWASNPGYALLLAE